MVVNTNSDTKNSPISKPYISGRWSSEEHSKFLKALELYGKNWKKIKEYIHTRSTSQIRSHAQKYFIKEFSTTDKLQNNQPETPKTLKLSKKISKPKQVPKLPEKEQNNFTFDVNFNDNYNFNFSEISENCIFQSNRKISNCLLSDDLFLENYDLSNNNDYYSDNNYSSYKQLLLKCNIILNEIIIHKSDDYKISTLTTFKDFLLSIISFLQLITAVEAGETSLQSIITSFENLIFEINKLINKTQISKLYLDYDDQTTLVKVNHSETTADLFESEQFRKTSFYNSTYYNYNN